MPPTNVPVEAMINGQRPAPVVAILIDPITGAPVAPGAAVERTQQVVSLLAAGTATGNWMTWQGGRGSVFVNGTFGGGQVALEARYNNAAHSLGSTGVLTANGVIGFELPAGIEIRAAITGATNPSINATAVSNRTI